MPLQAMRSAQRFSPYEVTDLPCGIRQRWQELVTSGRKRSTPGTLDELSSSSHRLAFQVMPPWPRPTPSAN